MPAKYIVTLTADERIELDKLVRTGTAPGRMRTHAQILLKADCGPQGPAWTDEAIQDALDVGSQTIHRVRQRFVEEGLDAALHQRRPTGWRERKLDGEAGWGSGSSPARPGLLLSAHRARALVVALAGRQIGGTWLC